MRIGRAILRACLMLTLVGSFAHAQPRRPGPGGGGLKGGGAAADPVDRREQIKKRIRAMRAYTLTEELSLDEQTAGKLFPTLSRYDDETDKLLEKRVDVQRRLNHANQLKDPKAIDRLIDEAVTNQKAFWDLEDKRLADLRKILTPAQTAKLLVVLPAIERKIQNQLRKAIVQHAKGAGQNGGAADEDDDDKEPDEIAPRPRPQVQRRAAPPGAEQPTQRSNAPGNTPPCDPFAPHSNCSR